jgi:hypothetical protein
MEAISKSENKVPTYRVVMINLIAEFVFHKDALCLKHMYFMVVKRIHKSLSTLVLTMYRWLLK